MDFSQLIETLQTSFSETVPNLLAAVVILLAGWLVAVVVRAVLRKILGLAKVNEKIASATGNEINVRDGVAVAGYLVVMLFTLVAFFGTLRLDAISGTLQALVDKIVGFVPALIAGGVLLVVAWILASILRAVVGKALAATRMDEKLGSGEGKRPMSETLGTAVFWLAILFFMPGVLGALQMEGLAQPVQGMVDQIVGLLPNLLAATVVALVGWFLARILRDVVASLLASAGADRLGERTGLRGNLTLSRLAGLVVCVLVFVPALITALNALQIEAISAPATEMLSSMMAAIPGILAAVVILAVAYFVAGLVGSLLSSVLAGIGFDGVPQKLGLGATAESAATPSAIAGKVAVFFIMLFATVEAANRLGFTQVSELVATVTEFGGQVLLGATIIAVGFWLSGVAAGAVARLSNAKDASMHTFLVRFAILGIVLAIGLRAMGLADDIVNLAFGLTLGAIAVATALSFGLGGRAAAGRQMEHWFSQLREQPKRRSTKTPPKTVQKRLVAR